MIPVNPTDTLIISIEEARKLMGKENGSYTDDEIKEIILLLTLMSDVVIDDKIKKLVQAKNI